MFFNYAVTKGWGSVNPLDKLSLGLSSEISDRAPRIQPENVQKIIKDGLEGESLLDRAMVITALATGMRQGELRALPWGNVDFEDGCIRVSQAVKHGNTAKVADPKTKRGFRTIPVPAEVTAVLKELKVASQWSSDDHFVFASGRGTVQLKKVYPQIMSRICDRAGVPLMRWGDFRHFYASVLISGLGEDWAEVAALMGHSNASFTYRQYSHFVKSKVKQDATRSVAASAMFG
jgi:integrase